METVKVDILNPKARKLLNDLADLDLIAIRKSTGSDFSDVLKRSDPNPKLYQAQKRSRSKWKRYGSYPSADLSLISTTTSPPLIK